MTVEFGRTIILVKDYDEAFAFYQQNLGCRKLFDATTNKRRYLHAGFDNNDLAGIWFMKAETSEQLKKVGDQTAGHPLMVVYTKDLKNFHKRLNENKVKITVEPVFSQEYAFLHFHDLYGNDIVAVQLHD